MSILAALVSGAGPAARGALEAFDVASIASTAVETDDAELLKACIKAAFAAAACDAGEAQSSESLSKARTSRDTLATVLSAALHSEMDECALLAVGLVHEARVLFSPAAPSLCWTPGSDLLDLADRVMNKALGGVEQGAEPQDVLCATLQLQVSSATKHLKAGLTNFLACGV